MTSLTDTDALVLGRDPSGEAAVALLRRLGARAVLVDATQATVAAGVMPDLVILSTACRETPALARELAARGVAVIGERELAFRHSLCLHVAVTGASGKTTTVELVAHLLRAAGRRVAVAAGIARPASALAEVSRDLDFLVHAVAPAELEHFETFRPVVGVLLNAPADHPETGEPWDDYVRRLARLFTRQLSFDWSIIQSEALAHLRAVDAVFPGKQITFSATSRQADLGLDRGLLVSRLEGWIGPLWDMAKGRMSGLHLAEDAMAALAVGRVLRLTLEEMTPALASFQAPPGRMETLGTVDGVRFIHDGSSSNLDALAKALLSLAPTPPDSPFIVLIAGGPVAGRHFYDLGPILSPRVRQAYLYGESAHAMQAAWQLFTPCSPRISLLDAAKKAVVEAWEGEVVLFSPACPGEGVLTPLRPGGDVFREVFESRLRESSGDAAIGGAATLPSCSPLAACSTAGAEPNLKSTVIPSQP